MGVCFTFEGACYVLIVLGILLVISGVVLLIYKKKKKDEVD